jgi:Flp pilus assembly protein TadD
MFEELKFARRLIRSGRLMDARAVLLKLAEQSPADEVFVCLAEVSVQLGLVDEAIRWGSAVTAGSPDEPSALVPLAAAYQRAGRDEDEARTLDRLRVLTPDNPHAPMLSGIRLAQRGRFEDAEAEFLRCLDLRPDQGGAYYNVVFGRRMTEADEALVDRMDELAAGAR